MKRYIMALLIATFVISGGFLYAASVNGNKSEAQNIRENQRPLIKCTHCNGTGWKGSFQCIHCKGKGGF